MRCRRHEWNRNLFYRVLCTASAVFRSLGALNRPVDYLHDACRSASARTNPAPCRMSPGTNLASCIHPAATSMHADQHRRDESCLMHTPCSDPRWIAHGFFSGWDRSMDLRLTSCTQLDTRRHRCILSFFFWSTVFCLPIPYRGLSSSSMLMSALDQSSSQCNTDQPSPRISLAIHHEAIQDESINVFKACLMHSRTG